MRSKIGNKILLRIPLSWLGRELLRRPSYKRAVFFLQSHIWYLMYKQKRKLDQKMVCIFCWQFLVYYSTCIYKHNNISHCRHQRMYKWMGQNGLILIKTLAHVSAMLNNLSHTNRTTKCSIHVTLTVKCDQISYAYSELIIKIQYAGI